MHLIVLINSFRMSYRTSTTITHKKFQNFKICAVFRRFYEHLCAKKFLNPLKILPLSCPTTLYKPYIFLLKKCTDTHTYTRYNPPHFLIANPFHCFFALRAKKLWAGKQNSPKWFNNDFHKDYFPAHHFLQKSSGKGQE